MRLFDRVIAKVLVGKTTGSANFIVKSTGVCKGFQVWKSLVTWYRPRSDVEKNSLLMQFNGMKGCSIVKELRRGIEEYEFVCREREERFRFFDQFSGWQDYCFHSQ